MNILIRIKSPIQSWGDTSKHTTKGKIRYTNDIPTKSGILGLINCCFGIRDNSLKTKFEIISILAKKKYDKIDEFQTCGSNFDSTDPIFANNGKSNVVRELSGVGYRNCGRTVGEITNRQYILDADFFLILNVDDEFVDEFKKHLQNPIWQPFFGRKNCIPTSRIYVDCGKSEDEFVDIVKKIFNQTKILKYSSQIPSSNYSCFEIFDEPLEIKYKNSGRMIYKFYT